MPQYFNTKRLSIECNIRNDNIIKNLVPQSLTLLTQHLKVFAETIDFVIIMDLSRFNLDFIYIYVMIDTYTELITWPRKLKHSGWTIPLMHWGCVFAASLVHYTIFSIKSTGKLSNECVYCFRKNKW